ncbi:MAG: hypothetical protein ABH874_05000 [Methanobacteriota archaeon]
MKKFLVLLILLTTGSSDLAYAIASEYDVIVVRSDLPFDWTLAQAYSNNFGIPIVGTVPDRLDEDVRKQLYDYGQFGFHRAIIIGGEKAISQRIQEEIETIGFVAHRFGEADRYGTSARLAIVLYPSSKGAVLVNGEGYGGLLAARRVAAATGDPILFIKREEVPASVLDALGKIDVRKILLINYELSENVKKFLVSEGYEVEIISSASDISKFGIDIKYIYLTFGVLLGILGILGLQRFRKYKEKVPYTLLTGDEEKVVKVILDNGGEMTQDLLPEKTGFSRPKISRIVADLVGRDIISKEQYGRTQKLKIKKEFYEDIKK